MCGHNFTGIELRQEQVDINNRVIEGRDLPIRYICDDGQNVAAHFSPDSQDMLFSCPPYYDLEVYSDKENDASNQDTYEGFIGILRNAFSRAITCLERKPLCRYRRGRCTQQENGRIYNFVDDVKRIFCDNGMLLYNELILSKRAQARLYGHPGTWIAERSPRCTKITSCSTKARLRTYPNISKKSSSRLMRFHVLIMK